MSLKVLAALSRAQAKFEAVKRSAENPAFKRGGKVSRYATLEDVIESVRPALIEEGLILLQENIYVNGFFGVKSRLIHIESGEEVGSQFIAPLEKQSAQGVASILTYARRYEYFTLLGLVTPDDDGNAASGVRPQTGQNWPKQAKTPKSTDKAAQNGPKTAPAAPPEGNNVPVGTTEPVPVESPSNNPVDEILTPTTATELKAYIEHAKSVSAKLTAAGMTVKSNLAVGGQLVKFITDKTGYDSLSAIPKEKWEQILNKLDTAIETNATALIQIIQEKV
jgi:hypothetical protein